KENTDKAYVAPEKFSSKVLTWLGKMPLFKNTEVVQKTYGKYQSTGPKDFTDISPCTNGKIWGNSG
ncbi:pathogenicity island 1 effector protein StpP, partial [Salmonella enterica subsp. enterica serovar Enteritidis str. 76-2651]